MRGDHLEVHIGGRSADGPCSLQVSLDDFLEGVGVSDALPEEIEARGEAIGPEALHRTQSVVQGGPGDVAAGRAGGPPPGPGRLSDERLEGVIRGDRVQEPPSDTHARAPLAWPQWLALVGPRPKRSGR